MYIQQETVFCFMVIRLLLIDFNKPENIMLWIAHYIKIKDSFKKSNFFPLFYGIILFRIQKEQFGKLKNLMLIGQILFF